MALGQEMEEFGTKEAMADDQKVSEVLRQERACRSPISTTRPSRSGGAIAARHRVERLCGQEARYRPNCSSLPKAYKYPDRPSFETEATENNSDASRPSI